MAMEIKQRVIGTRSPARGGEGAEIYPWYTREGAAVVAPIEQAWAQEGRVFAANAGSVTTPLTFGAGAIDTTEPDFDLLVPTNASIMVVPLQILIHMEAFGSDAIFEGMAAVGIGGTQGTDTDVVPRCLRHDTPAGASLCTIGAASNADAVYMTSQVSELFRFGIQKVATVGTGDDDSNRGGETYIWTARGSGVYPYLVAGSRLNVFAAAQAGTGFIEVIYAELPLQ